MGRVKRLASFVTTSLFVIVFSLESSSSVHAYISLIIANLLLNNSSLSSSSSSSLLEQNTLQNQTKSYYSLTLSPNDKFDHTHHYSRSMSGKDISN